MKDLKVDNRAFGIEQQKKEFEVELCAYGEHVIVKMYKPLLKLEMVNNKDYMIKWAKNFKHNILMKQWEKHTII